MFASIMDGMKAQRERSTTNRREAAKLFNEHLKNQSELGIEVTEQSLSDAWDANSGGVLRKHAPTQQRLQSIVAAQNKSLAEKQAVADIDALDRDRKIRGFNTTDLETFFTQNAGAVPDSDSYQEFLKTLGGNSLRIDDANLLTGNGANMAAMQSAFERKGQDAKASTVSGLIELGVTSEAALQFSAPDMPIETIRAMVAKYQKGVDRSDVLEGRDDLIFEQAQEDRVTNLAREIVEQAQADSNFKLNTAQLEAALLQAKVAVKRLVVTNSQDDATFAQNFEANVVAAATLAKQTINAEIDRIRNMTAEDLAAEQLATTNKQGNAEAVYNFGQKQVVDTAANAATQRDVSLQPAMDLRDAKKDINATFKTATIESVTASLAAWGITDPTVIKQTWDETRSQQEVFDLTGMTTHNNAIEQKLMKATTTNQKRVADFKQLTNSTLLDNFVGLPDKYKPEINNVAQRYIIDSSIAQEMRVFVDNEIQSGAWENANPIQITAALNEWLESINVPTYSSQMAQLQANSRSLAGVTQYTPIRFKEVYMGEFQTDAQYFIDQMNNASQSDNLAGYTTAKASLAILLNETQQDLSARKKDPQKAFGMRASQAEMSAVTTELDQLIRTMIDSSKEIEAPVKKVEADKELRYDPSLFTPDFGSNSRIKTIDDAVNYLDAQTSTSFYGERDDLVNLQEEFRNLSKSHEESKVELGKTTVANDQLKLDKIIKENLIRLNKITFEVKKIMRKVIKDSENF